MKIHLWNGFIKGHSVVKCSNKLGLKLTFHPNETTCKKCLAILKESRKK